MSMHRWKLWFGTAFVGLVVASPPALGADLFAEAGDGALAEKGASSSVAFFVNAAADHDYGLHTVLPPSFGAGEFTLEVWIRPDDSFPIGPTTDGTPQQLTNWSDADVEPYSGGGWWFEGNFLLDGHNNSSFDLGTFSLQMYGGGRVRWLFGDGGDPGPGGNWSAQAYPATNTPSLLDGQWHQITVVRRWEAGGGADLELWVDGALVAVETTPMRTDMRTYWDTWASFPSGQEGWFWGVEKQAAVGVLSQYEDYKGPIDELRFWDRAKSPGEIMSDWSQPANPGDPGLVGLFRFSEGTGTLTCDELDAGRCMDLINMKPGYWSSDAPPIGDGSPIFRDGFESGNTSAWSTTVG